MSKVNKLINIIDRIISSIILIFFIIVMLIGGYALYDAFYIYNNAKLPEEIANLAPKENQQDFSLLSLQEINPDICAWLRINNTNIDYPVVIGVDNSEYLNINYKKEYSTYGSVFLDYRNDRMFNDDYSIVYGHNMTGDLMFADVKKFVNDTYFNSHLEGSLYTDNVLYKVDVIAAAKVNAFAVSIYELNFFNNGRNDMILNAVKENAVISRDIEVTAENKLLLLSTCDSVGSSDRVVLLARLTKVSDNSNEEIINEEYDSKLDIEPVEENKVQQETKEDTKPKFQLRISRRKLVLWILVAVVVIIYLVVIILKIQKKKTKGKH